MNALKLLKQQHDEVKALFKEYEELGERAQKSKRQCFFQIADRLSAHTTIEERLFYPAAKAEDTEDLLLESLEEHLSAKRVISDLLDLDPGDETFDAKMKVLQELIEHHVEEEESELFKKVKKVLSADALEDLGLQMETLFQELLEGEPREEVRAETDEAAPLQ